jgi:hypothetical protein
MPVRNDFDSPVSNCWFFLIVLSKRAKAEPILFLGEVICIVILYLATTETEPTSSPAAGKGKCGEW